MANICPCTLGNSVSLAFNNLRKVKKMNQELPEQSGTGTVLSRRVETIYSLEKSDSSWGYLAKFRLENGEDVELKTTEEQYGTLKEGITVKLVWQGENLTAFTQE